MVRLTVHGCEEDEDEEAGDVELVEQLRTESLNILHAANHMLRD